MKIGSETIFIACRGCDFSHYEEPDEFNFDTLTQLLEMIKSQHRQSCEEARVGISFTVNYDEE